MNKYEAVLKLSCEHKKYDESNKKWKVQGQGQPFSNSSEIFT